MRKVYARCRGLDVHKDSIAACLMHDGRSSVETLGTTSREIFRLGDWLAERQVSVVAMESTGVDWKPIWNLLDGRLELMLVNAQHVKRVPGRKTDVSDSLWVAQLLQHGLLSPSLVPDRPRRELRDLTRSRTTFIADRARVVNRVQKVPLGPPPGVVGGDLPGPRRVGGQAARRPDARGQPVAQAGAGAKRVGRRPQARQLLQGPAEPDRIATRP